MEKLSEGYGKYIFVLTIAVVLGGCDETISCTAELRMPITVRVSSPEELPIDAVTATLRVENVCERRDRDNNTPSCYYDNDTDASSEACWFYCSEQGEGEYKVSVKSGDLTWTQRVYIAGDKCHTIESKELIFLLNPAEAD